MTRGSPLSLEGVARPAVEVVGVGPAELLSISHVIREGCESCENVTE